MTSRDTIMQRLGQLASLDGQNENILQQLMALKAENANMLLAMQNVIPVLRRLIDTRANLDEILQSTNQSYDQMKTTIQTIIGTLQNAPTTAELTNARTALEDITREAESASPGTASTASPGTDMPDPFAGGYSYKPYTSYNSRRPSSYKVSMKKGKKKYSKRKRRMTNKN